MTARYTHFPALLSDAGATDMIRLCERFGSYGMYGQKPIEEELGRGLYQRHDAAMNYIRTGGRFGRQESFEQLSVRTNYFRETYAYERPVVDGIEGFLWHEGFLEAARAMFDCPVIVPAIVYANLLVPGQELAVHTDVPEFRGANRTKDPEWLLVVMHHSGLFERWRIPIATGVSWFHGCRGGDFAFYPDGPGGPPATVPPPTTPRSSSTRTACSTASIGWPRDRRPCRRSGSACGSPMRRVTGGAWVRRTRRSSATAGTTSGSRCPGRHTAFPTSPAGAPCRSTPTI